MYQADLFCEDCGEEIRDALTNSGNAPDDPDDEYSYDSDDFPKGPESTGESDSVQHCGSHEACVNAIEMPDGSKIGVWLGNDLTTEGLQSVCEAVQDGSAVSVLWYVWYEDQLKDMDPPCPPPRPRVRYQGGKLVRP
jgi:hypothetical protein